MCGVDKAQVRLRAQCTSCSIDVSAKSVCSHVFGMCCFTYLLAAAQAKAKERERLQRKRERAEQQQQQQQRAGKNKQQQQQAGQQQQQPDRGKANSSLKSPPQDRGTKGPTSKCIRKRQSEGAKQQQGGEPPSKEAGRGKGKDKAEAEDKGDIGKDKGKRGAEEGDRWGVAGAGVGSCVAGPVAFLHRKATDVHPRKGGNGGCVVGVDSWLPRSRGWTIWGHWLRYHWPVPTECQSCDRIPDRWPESLQSKERTLEPASTSGGRSVEFVRGLLVPVYQE